MYLRRIDQYAHIEWHNFEHLLKSKVLANWIIVGSFRLA